MLDAVIDNAPVGMALLVPPKRTFSRVNRAFCELLGYTEAELIGASYQLIIHPDDAEAVADRVAQFDSGRLSAKHLERRYVTKDGGIVWADASIASVRDGLGDVQYIIIQLKDRTEAKKAADAISRLAAIVESSNDVIVSTTIDGTITSWNPAAERVYGYTAEEAIGQPARSPISSRNTPSCSSRRWSRSNADARCPISSVSAGPRTGASSTLQLSVFPVFDEQGWVTGSATIGRDVTDRKRQASALAEAEDRFRNAFDSAPIGMALVSPDGVFMRVNRTFCEIVGYPEQELLTLGFPDITHPDDLEDNIALMKQLLAGEIRVGQREKRYLHKDGSAIWTNLSVSLVRSAAREPLHFIAQIQDITAAREAQSALRLAEEQFRGAFEEAPIGMALLTPARVCLSANRALSQILGYGKEELVGMSFVDITHPDDVGADVELAAQIREGAISSAAIDKRYINKYGRVVWANLSASVVRGPDGEPLHWIAQIQDITERRLAEQEHEAALHELRDAQQIARLGSWSAAPDSFNSWSPELYRIVGRDPQLGPLRWTEFVDEYVVPEDRERVLASYLDVIGADREAEFDYRIRDDDGHDRIVHALARQDPERPGYFVGTVQDVTAARAAARQLEAAEDRFRRAFESAPIGMALSDLTGRYTQVNRAMCEITGYTPDELVKRSFHAITHPDDIAGDRGVLEALTSGRLTHFHREKRYIRASGEPVWVSIDSTVLRDREGNATQLLAQVVDITKRRHLETELRHLAGHDPLTGLVNRRGLEAELDHHIAQINRYGAQGALLVLDLDHFKTINDTLGHSAGDQVIVAVAGLLRSRLRASDTVARIGGDEFAILLPVADGESARSVAEQIVADINRDGVSVGDHQVRRVTASVGVAMFREGQTSGEEVLVDADLAMYDAKEAGRDRVAVYSPEQRVQPQMKARMAWIERIRRALDEGQLTLHAQPIVELDTGETHQYELLLRMLDDTGDTIPPASFISIAERYDLIQELDRWVAAEAVKLIEQYRDELPNLAVEINVSGKSLGDPQLSELVESELRRSGIDPASLIFEVTETAAVSNIEQARQFAERLSSLGCRFALDDFGRAFGTLLLPQAHPV